MANNKQKSVIAVHWKRFTGTIDTDYFASLEVFCGNFPGFDYAILDQCLNITKGAFEDESVLVEIQPAIKGVTVIDKVDLPNLPAWLFWEVNYSKLDWQWSYRYVIERVIDTGAPEHWAEMVRFYSREKVVQALTQEITYLTNLAVEAVCQYFQLSEESLKCYAKKQLNRKLNLDHWI